MSSQGQGGMSQGQQQQGGMRPPAAHGDTQGNVRTVAAGRFSPIPVPAAAGTALTSDTSNSLQGNSLQGTSLQGNSMQGNALQGKLAAFTTRGAASGSVGAASASIGGGSSGSSPGAALESACHTTLAIHLATPSDNGCCTPWATQAAGRGMPGGSAASPWDAGLLHNVGRMFAARIPEPRLSPAPLAHAAPHGDDEDAMHGDEDAMDAMQRPLSHSHLAHTVQHGASQHGASQQHGALQQQSSMHGCFQQLHGASQQRQQQGSLQQQQQQGSQHGSQQLGFAHGSQQNSQQGSQQQQQQGSQQPQQDLQQQGSQQQQQGSQHQGSQQQQGSHQQGSQHQGSQQQQQQQGLQHQGSQQQGSQQQQQQGLQHGTRGPGVVAVRQRSGLQWPAAAPGAWGSVAASCVMLSAPAGQALTLAQAQQPLRSLKATSGLPDFVQHRERYAFSCSRFALVP